MHGRCNQEAKHEATEFLPRSLVPSFPRSLVQQPALNFAISRCRANSNHSVGFGCAFLLLIACLGLVRSDSIAQPDAPIPTCPPIGNPYVYGKAGWWDVNDVIQFIGDAQYNGGPTGGCGSHSESWNECWIDPGFLFREVFNLNVSNCSYTPSTTCDAVKVQCCFFWDNASVCLDCSVQTCPGCNMCMSFWRVKRFLPEGLTTRGCYELEFVSACLTPTCIHTGIWCSQYRYWGD